MTDQKLCGKPIGQISRPGLFLKGKEWKAEISLGSIRSNPRAEKELCLTLQAKDASSGQVLPAYQLTVLLPKLK